MKILIIANNVPWKSWNAKIEALKAWFSPAIDLSIDLQKVSLEVPFEPYIDSEGKKYPGVKKSWISKTILPMAKGYDIVILTMNKEWQSFPAQGYSSVIEGKQVISIGSPEKATYDFQGKKYPGDRWFNVARHELCHALYKMQSKFDMTHTYWKAGNIEQVLVDLRQPKTLVVTLTRDTYGKDETLGSLNVGNFRCKTLERPWKNNQKNISCIPEGEYRCKWTFSPKFMRYTYEVQGVPNRSGIRIHKGNYFYDIQGCILLGDGYSDLNKDGTVDIINSTKIIKDFETLMGGQDFILKII